MAGADTKFLLSADDCIERCQHFTGVFLGWVGEVVTVVSAVSKFPVEWLSPEFQLQQGNLLAELDTVEMRLDVIMENLATIERMAAARADFDRVRAGGLLDAGLRNAEIIGPEIDRLTSGGSRFREDVEAWIPTRRPTLTAGICLRHSMTILAASNNFMSRVKQNRDVAREEFRELLLNIEVSIEMTRRLLRAAPTDIPDEFRAAGSMLRRVVMLRLWATVNAPPRVVPATTWEDAKPGPALVREHALRHVLVSRGKNLTVG